jgi:hypothetical protein
VSRNSDLVHPLDEDNCETCGMPELVCECRDESPGYAESTWEPESPAAGDGVQPWQTERDYLSMSHGKLAATCADDGRKWATAFCQFYRRRREEDSAAGRPPSEPEPDWLVAWFASAIEVACDVRLAVRDRRIAELQRQWRDFEEREAARCPEDVPFDDYIIVLEEMVEDEKREKLTAERERDQARQGLRKYGKHLKDCASEFSTNQLSVPCDCGLREALGETAKEPA